jgi:hypothetical protein
MQGETIAQMMTRMQTGISRNPDRWLIIGDGQHAIKWSDKTRIQMLFDRMHKYIGELEDKLNAKGIAEQTAEA